MVLWRPLVPWTKHKKWVCVWDFLTGIRLSWHVVWFYQSVLILIILQLKIRASSLAWNKKLSTFHVSFITYRPPPQNHNFLVVWSVSLNKRIMSVPSTRRYSLWNPLFLCFLNMKRTETSWLGGPPTHQRGHVRLHYFTIPDNPTRLIWLIGIQNLPHVALLSNQPKLSIALNFLHDSDHISRWSSNSCRWDLVISSSKMEMYLDMGTAFTHFFVKGEKSFTVEENTKWPQGKQAAFSEHSPLFPSKTREKDGKQNDLAYTITKVRPIFQIRKRKLVRKQLKPNKQIAFCPKEQKVNNFDKTRLNLRR